MLRPRLVGRLAAVACLLLDVGIDHDDLRIPFRTHVGIHEVDRERVAACQARRGEHDGRNPLDGLFAHQQFVESRLFHDSVHGPAEALFLDGSLPGDDVAERIAAGGCAPLVFHAGFVCRGDVEVEHFLRYHVVVVLGFEYDFGLRSDLEGQVFGAIVHAVVAELHVFIDHIHELERHIGVAARLRITAEDLVFLDLLFVLCP